MTKRIEPVEDYALIAAGSVYEQLHGGKPIAELKVDGKKISNPIAAIHAYHESQKTPAENAPNFIDRLADKYADKVDEWEQKLDSSKFGRRLKSFLNMDPEHVARQADVEVTFADGETRRIPLKVLDRSATCTLQSLSMGVCLSKLLKFIPLAGNIIPAAAGLGTAIASGVSAVLGRDHLARALLRTAGKYGLIAIPFPGVTITAALAALTDYDQHDLAQHAPSVSRIVDPSSEEPRSAA